MPKKRIIIDPRLKESFGSKSKSIARRINLSKALLKICWKKFNVSNKRIFLAGKRLDKATPFSQYDVEVFSKAAANGKLLLKALQQHLVLAEPVLEAKEKEKIAASIKQTKQWIEQQAAVAKIIKDILNRRAKEKK